MDSTQISEPECPRCRAAQDKRNRQARERRARKRAKRPPLKPSGLDMDLILMGVAYAFHVTCKDIQSEHRLDQKISAARHVAMYLLYELSGQSYPAVGKFLHRAHSTVMHGYKKTAARIMAEPGYKSLIDHIRSAILSERACAA